LLIGSMLGVGMCMRCALPCNSAACASPARCVFLACSLQRFSIHARRAGGLADPRCRQHVSGYARTRAPCRRAGGRAPRKADGRTGEQTAAGRQAGRQAVTQLQARDSSCLLQHLCALVVCCRFIEVYHWIRSHYPYWDRNAGRDHMLVRGRGRLAGRHALCCAFVPACPTLACLAGFAILCVLLMMLRCDARCIRWPCCRWQCTTRGPAGCRWCCGPPLSSLTGWVRWARAGGGCDSFSSWSAHSSTVLPNCLAQSQGCDSPFISAGPHRVSPRQWHGVLARQLLGAIHVSGWKETSGVASVLLPHCGHRSCTDQAAAHLPACVPACLPARPPARLQTPGVAAGGASRQAGRLPVL
jgi:hypothetical protein